MSKADRPWDWKDRPTYRLGVSLGRPTSQNGGQVAAGWAAVEFLPQATGEINLGEPLSPERAALEAVMEFRRHVAGINPDDWPEVQLYSYSRRSWPRSVAAAEGGTHEEHKRRLKAAEQALRNEGARVRIKEV